VKKIKSRKQICIALGVISIAIIIFAPTALGYLGVKFPYYVAEIEGSRVSGDLSSFQHPYDDNIYEYVGDGTSLHRLSFTAHFENAGNVGGGNYIVCLFRNYGWCVITMTIYYSGSGADRYYILDTHGLGDDGFVLEFIEIPDRKVVHSINIFANNLYVRPEIEIDYLGVHYF